MNLNQALGVCALLYGLYTVYVRFTDPTKLGKLEPMRKQWGETAGTVVHVVGYTIMPIVLGILLIRAGLAQP